ncbi:hypothetical protein Micbo1qcDRAFT_165787 [Microdochium bolleyi]|uniref:Uncharacterized protein n=1 Tax=Microdochium bolleyi TaxID=196109 RepID=A0A136IVW0_9PEZI|nr:hypothetical protein Micbo1qcDRAFT_165787 [Microdochium bolleyi]
MPREVLSKCPPRILDQIPLPSTAPSLPGAPLHLLTLPSEIRHHIWTIFYREVDRPWYRYAVDVGHNVEATTIVPVALARTCKQLLHEITPLLYHPVALDFHIVYPEYWVEQLAFLPKKEVRKGIDHIIFHVAQPEQYAWSNKRPPKRPVKFHRFPNLVNFTVCVPLHVPVEQLVPENAEDRSPDVYPTCRDLAGDSPRENPYIPRETVQKARDAYCALADGDRVALWRNRYSARALLDLVGKTGRGGWLSRIVDPEVYPDALTLDADIDEYGYNEEYDGDYEGQGTSSAGLYGGGKDDLDNEPDRLSQFQAIAARLHVMVEFELWATADYEVFDSGSRQPPTEVHKHPLLLRLDPRRKEIVEVRLLDEAESKLRERQREQAT